jgi:hypothetical protein
MWSADHGSFFAATLGATEAADEPTADSPVSGPPILWHNMKLYAQIFFAGIVLYPNVDVTDWRGAHDC